MIRNKDLVLPMDGRADDLPALVVVDWPLMTDSQEDDFDLPEYLE